MRFKKLTLGRLPRVFVNMLAMDEGDRAVLFHEIRLILATRGISTRQPGGNALAELACDILYLPKKTRLLIVPELDWMLDRLLEEDFFGTEGQLDPRGDHRE